MKILSTLFNPILKDIWIQIIKLFSNSSEKSTHVLSSSSSSSKVDSKIVYIYVICDSYNVFLGFLVVFFSLCIPTWPQDHNINTIISIYIHQHLRVKNFCVISVNQAIFHHLNERHIFTFSFSFTFYTNSHRP